MSATILQRPTLVLNRNWQPINITSVARALVMLWNETAKVVDPTSYELFDWDDWSKLVPGHDEPIVRSPQQVFRVPEVITLRDFDRLPSASVTFSRRNVFRRDHFTCQYCGKQPGGDELTIDHVVPRAQGGESSWANCVLACLDCNKRKADRTPEQAGFRLRKPPVKPAWRPLYSMHSLQMTSWAKFISEAYWNVELNS